MKKSICVIVFTLALVLGLNAVAYAGWWEDLKEIAYKGRYQDKRVRSTTGARG